MLFVQTGDARPKCEGRLGPLGEIPWQRCPAALKAALGECGLSSEQQLAVESADRWWLVECKNAEAGRGTIYIALNPPPVGSAFTTTFPVGRILAQGGRPGWV